MQPTIMPSGKQRASPSEDEPPAKYFRPESAPTATAGAKAAANGVEPIPRAATPRPPKANNGLVVVHWNIAGLSSLLKSPTRKALFERLLASESPDIIALSEHKLSLPKAAHTAQELMGLAKAYTSHWAICTAKQGYSGMGVLVKKELKVVGVWMDQICMLKEGRTITVELEDIYVVATYVPNSGADLKRIDLRIGTWDPELRAYITRLQRMKPVCLVGDMNVAHLDIDIWNVGAKHISKSAGTTPRERESFGRTLREVGLVDAFRELHSNVTGCFTFWSTRSGNQHLNRGLRLDYSLVSRSLVDDSLPLRLHCCDLLRDYAPSGDHCPTIVGLKRV